VLDRDIAELMKRLITAPCVGIVVGALELGTLFAVLTMLDPCTGCFLGGGSSEWAYFIGTFGMIGGGVLGGIIGLVVALRDAHGRSGLLLGGAIGLGFTILVAIRTVSPGDLFDPFGNPWSTVAFSLLPLGASIGFLSAVATVPSKEPRPAEAEPSRSHRIFD
jgi:hypothetical protein